ncbi:hypothetical protein C8Q74DRAFT_1302753 [Fomes fomentarius]|nr:hypothetical protein C8Q74DRAFT_1302753 [Fomes fomentarius]
MDPARVPPQAAARMPQSLVLYLALPSPPPHLRRGRSCELLNKLGLSRVKLAGRDTLHFSTSQNPNLTASTNVVENSPGPGCADDRWGCDGLLPLHASPILGLRGWRRVASRYVSLSVEVTRADRRTMEKWKYACDRMTTHS